MIARWTAWLRRLRRSISRSEWFVRWLGLPRSEGTGSEHGLLLIQIDGLSRRQFEKALHDGRLPHLQRLLRHEHYRLYTLYSGLPSSTPAVQGELFYGVRGAVPAFSFQDHGTGQSMHMLDQTAATAVEARLAQQDEGLLQGGSSYCNIYTGGAAHAHFCATEIGWDHLLRAIRPSKLVLLILSHSWSLVRILGLSLIELALAIIDCMRGLIRGRDLWKELTFIPSRVGVSIVLRELAIIGATLDVTRGIPIVHVNLLGYDEQAHRRGPSSAFAHWALNGIDFAVRRLWDAAKRSAHREYDVWIFSDHGQEATRPYRFETGRSLLQAVNEVLQQVTSEAVTDSKIVLHRGVQSYRAAWIGHSWLARLLSPRRKESHPDVGLVPLAAMGPVGHVYLRHLDAQHRRREIARQLVQQAHIPAVLVVDDRGQVEAFTPRGTFPLPGHAAEVVGSDHPFLEEIADDLVRMCQHPDAGSLVLLGWRSDDTPLTFALENGGHAGPGPEETRAFALLPEDVPLAAPNSHPLRMADLRHAAQAFLGRATRRRVQAAAAVPAPSPPTHLRVMTYNVHACIGMDGKMSPARIARVIRQCRADVIALQELDVNRRRTGVLDQAHAIAQKLEMDFHFHPAWELEEESYGDAILSRYPLRLVHRGPLELPRGRFAAEPRGALWVELQVNGCRINILNTHLGLTPGEQAAQLDSLLSQEWLDHPSCAGPLILCGDFNAPPFSRSYRRVATRLRDAQRALAGHRPRATWLSGRPVNRIDHVFVSDDVQIRRIEVPRSHLTRIASDHLPLIVELAIPCKVG